MGGKHSKTRTDKGPPGVFIAPKGNPYKKTTKKTKKKKSNDILLGNSNDGILIKINKLTNVPDVEDGNGTPYVKFCLQPREGTDKEKKKAQTGHTRTTSRRHTCNPVYNEFFFFPISKDLQATTDLQLRVMEKDEFTKDDFLADVHIPLDSFKQDSELKVDATSACYEPITISAQRCDDDPSLFKDGHRTVHLFIIRHGESVWNEAQDNKDLGNMLAFDHPLNKTGIGQAEHLRETWMAAKEAPPHTDIAQQVLNERFFAADSKVLTSPLTRASQTCVIGLRGHPALARPNKIEFARSLRENKNYGGIDCVGKEVGDGVTTRIRELLTKEGSEELATSSLDVDFDSDDVQSIWWTETFGKDNKTLQEHEHNELLQRVRFNPSDSVIAVGHSHWFRGFCKHLELGSRDNGCVYGEGLTAETFGSKKLDNAACLGLELDFESATGKCKLLRADLMFDSKLQDE